MIPIHNCQALFCVCVCMYAYVLLVYRRASLANLFQRNEREKRIKGLIASKFIFFATPLRMGYACTRRTKNCFFVVSLVPPHHKNYGIIFMCGLRTLCVWVIMKCCGWHCSFAVIYHKLWKRYFSFCPLYESVFIYCLWNRFKWCSFLIGGRWLLFLCLRTFRYL